MSRWKTVYTTIRFTAYELRQLKDAVEFVRRNPDPHLDYTALERVNDKLAKRIGDLNYGRLVGEDAL